jgi:hypothetical protein
MQIIELNKLSVITGETEKELNLYFTDAEDNNYIYRATLNKYEWLIEVLERRLKQGQNAPRQNELCKLT